MQANNLNDLYKEDPDKFESWNVKEELSPVVLGS